MYNDLCRKRGTHQDRCVLYCLPFSGLFCRD
ncbi:MAG: helix-hairpin-helix domain-containing protein [Bacillus subtilis]|nr:helix-hairpin-helix domain-containing protein [Bacillus subtilis]